MTSAGILQPTIDAIGQGAVNADVLHADETGLRVAKKLHWLHVLATDTLTWMGCHPKRGGEVFDALALLGQFKGVFVHDGWLPYPLNRQTWQTQAKQGHQSDWPITRFQRRCLAFHDPARCSVYQQPG